MQLLLLLNIFAIENFTQLDMAISPGIYQFKNQIFDKVITTDTVRPSNDAIWIDFAPALLHHNYVNDQKQKFQGYTFGISHWTINRNLVGLFIDSHKNEIEYIESGATYNNQLDIVSFGIFGSITKNKMNYLWLLNHSSASGDNYRTTVPIVLNDLKVKSKAFQINLEANRIFKTILGKKIFYKPFIGFDATLTMFGNLADITDSGSYIKTDISIGQELKYQSDDIDLRWKLYLRQPTSGRTATAKSTSNYVVTTNFTSTYLSGPYFGTGLSINVRALKKIYLSVSGVLEAASKDKYIAYISSGITIPTKL